MTTQQLFDLNHTIAGEYLDRYEKPWEALSGIHEYILKLGATLSSEKFDHPSEEIWIAKSAKIAPTASLNGALIIDENAEIRHCAYIRGNAIVGKGVVVGNSTELKNCILFDKVQVPHFNYVGDSIFGYMAHTGAGAITSNVRSDKRNIVIHDVAEIQTGLHKLVAMLGDRAEIGCNSVLNPGTIIGRDAIVYPCSCVRGIVPEQYIYKDAENIVLREVRL